ncbi:twin-arginine translocation signal domain-containing protein [Streptomyces sp. NBC_00162]|uniref:twin-arginine translocation signal domain-containing protein n=1 Tax=Streptomyces sp. NBC_00162 TaxID=2903629 RepID=UPI00214B5F36|nr:twin-arginine translocation signal domain-containing protein [Streptomyces sp. NBC_00162]UUU38846.1 twin-arginine translocation signal domain-containing protein [Streptomyces sp. NBC_00162]
MVLSRRDLMQGAAAGGLLLGFPGLAAPFEASAAPAARPLLDRVGEVCARLAPKGWRSLLLAVSRGTLDIGAPDLAEALARPIADLDRTVPGFADFAPGLAVRGIEPGSPARSLLYHALASAEVLTDGEGRSLGAFPALAEIEAVEDYVYGVRPPTLDRLREIAGDNALGVVVLAVDYRAATGSVHGRHADLCFSRTGIARMGTVDPFYDARARQFTPADPKRPFVFRTVPQRFAPYIAMQVTGADSRLFGPRDTVSGDDERSFWVPLHKLFGGPECIEGLDLSVTLGSHLVNEKLKHMHLFLREQGYPTDWTGKALEQYPFVIRGERIASLLPPPRHGSGVLGPRPAPFANRARFRDQWLSFNVSSDLVGDPGILYFSSVQLIPGSLETEPTYLEGTAPDNDRRAPEYVNIRHRLNPDGSLDDLNLDPDMDRIIREGGYRAQHYIDFAGDGSVAVRCPQLEAEIDTFKPAFCSVAPPDFFPLVNQRDLVAWWREKVPAAVRAALWAVPPRPLSEFRFAGDIRLPSGFDIYDDTLTAVVGQPAPGEPVPRQLDADARGRYSGLPDSAAGVTDPGWEVSQGLVYNEPGLPLQRYMQSYSLGTPFLEDVKLCAALGSYWPAAAPDGTRTFTPLKDAPGFPYPWPTVVPLTDAEIGMEPVPGLGHVPWDGIRGPRLETVGGREAVVYQDIDRADYITTMDRLSAHLTARVDLAETKARVLAMESVYWSLGIHDPEFVTRFGDRAVIEILKAKSAWAVLSFRTAGPADPDLVAAQQATGGRLTGPHRYRVVIYRPGAETRHPTDIQKVVVQIEERVLAFTDGAAVLLSRDGGPWRLDRSMPTS